MTNSEIIKLINAAHYAVASGTNNYAASTPLPAPPIQAYIAGQSYMIKFTNANTTAVTVNIDGLGAKNLYKVVTTPLASGDIPAGNVVLMVYDGTNFQALGGTDMLLSVNQRINSAASNFVQTII